MNEQTKNVVAFDFCVTNQPKTLPSFLKPFAVNTAAEFFRKFLPQKAVDALGGLMSGIAPNFGVSVPDWTKEASCQFWKYYGFQKGFNPYESVRDFGVLVGLVDHAIRQPLLKPKSLIDKLLTKAAPKMISFLSERVAQDLSPLQKAEFFAGWHKSSEIMAKIDNQKHLDMIKVAPIYLVISAAWKKIESHKTHAEREKWLRDEKVIKENVTSREVYQVFSIIGLPGAKPGRQSLSES